MTPDEQRLTRCLRNDADALWPPIKRYMGTGLRYILPVACSAALIWWLFRKVNFGQMMAVIHHDVEWRWIALMMAITTLSHMVRGYRWGMQLGAAGIHPTLQALFVSIFGNYSFNLVVPRLGEIWRCVFVSRRQRKPLSVVVGTLVGDRLSDALVVVVLAAVMVAVAGGAVTAFIDRYAVGRELMHWADNPWLWSVVTLVLSAVVGGWFIFRHYSFMLKVDTQLRDLWNGFKVLFTMRRKWLYAVLTVAIWACYFSETYVCFYAFPFTRHLLVTPSLAWGLLPGLVCFVFCSLSMVIPSNGGLGPWNLAMIFGLSLYGVGQTEAAAFAMLMWSAQALMLVALGVYTLVYVSVTSPRRQKRKGP